MGRGQVLPEPAMSGPTVEVGRQELRCPTCGAGEMHPNGEWLLIRGYKVDNWSQCLVCAGYYERNDPKDPGEAIDKWAKPTGGWFPPPWQQ